MSIKEKAVIALTVMSSWFGTSAAQNTKAEKSDNHTRTEQVTQPAAKKQTGRTADFKTKADTLAFKDAEKQSAKANDSIDKAVADSLLDVQKRANLKNAEELMLYVIAHFEGMKSKAYYDRAGKVWTINIGNTVRPDGKAVRPGDRISSEQQALEYVSAHIDKKMADDMVKYLPLDKMNEAEIAVIGSLLYNCGTGILRDRKGNPKEFAKLATEYFTTRSAASAQNFDKAFLNYCHVKKRVNSVLVERRKNELTFLHGKVRITVDEKNNIDENCVNLKNATLGSLYGCKGNPEKIKSRFCEESNFYCPTDSLKVAIDKQLKPRTYVSKKRPRATPRPRTTARRLAANDRGR